MSKFRLLSNEELENHLNGFLLVSFSYSSVSSFSRNPAEFERNYIYKQRGRISPTFVVGRAYHKALEVYFKAAKEGWEEPSLYDLLAAAKKLIDDTPTEEMRLIDSAPTVDKWLEVAHKKTELLINGFYGERETYNADIAEVLDVEVFCDEWITLLGEDIRLPIHAVVDMRVKTTDGKVVAIDHKQVPSFTKPEKLEISRHKQAILYTHALEAMYGEVIDEVWFMENKSSKNRDGTPQLRKMVIEMTPERRLLYEYLTLPAVNAMIDAVSDINHVYIINAEDTLCEVEELLDFKIKQLKEKYSLD